MSGSPYTCRRAWQVPAAWEHGTPRGDQRGRAGPGLDAGTRSFTGSPAGLLSPGPSWPPSAKWLFLAQPFLCWPVLVNGDTVS